MSIVPKDKDLGPKYRLFDGLTDLFAIVILLVIGGASAWYFIKSVFSETGINLSLLGLLGVSLLVGIVFIYKYKSQLNINSIKMIAIDFKHFLHIDINKAPSSTEELQHIILRMRIIMRTCYIIAGCFLILLIASAFYVRFTGGSITAGSFWLFLGLIIYLLILFSALIIAVKTHADLQFLYVPIDSNRRATIEKACGSNQVLNKYYDGVIKQNRELLNIEADALLSNVETSE